MPSSAESNFTNFMDTRIVQQGQALLVFKNIKTEIYGWKLQGLDSEEPSYEPLAKLELEAKHFALAPDQKSSVYLTGGGTGSDHDVSLSYVSRLDTEANQWTKLADMNMARQNHSAIVQGDRLYVFGGRKNDSLLSSIEFLELVGGLVWTTVTENESVKRMSATFFECGPKQIAVFGGLKVANLKSKDYAPDGYIFDTDSQEFKAI